MEKEEKEEEEKGMGASGKRSMPRGARGKGEGGMLDENNTNNKQQHEIGTGKETGRLRCEDGWLGGWKGVVR